MVGGEKSHHISFWIHSRANKYKGRKLSPQAVAYCEIVAEQTFHTLLCTLPCGSTNAAQSFSSKGA